MKSLIPPIDIQVLGITVKSTIVRDDEINNPDGGKNRYIVIKSSCSSKRWKERSQEHHFSSPVNASNFEPTLAQVRSEAATILAKQELGLVPEAPTDGGLGLKIIGPTGKVFNALSGFDLSTSPTRLWEEFIGPLELRPSGRQFAEEAPDGKIRLIPLFTATVQFGAHQHEVQILPTSMSVPCILGGEFFQKAIQHTRFLAGEMISSEQYRTLANVARCKKRLVLIAGKYGDQRARLEIIRTALARAGFEGIVLDDHPDIEEQSLSEKMVTYASISRFVVCDDLVASGHINELDICSERRFTTAVLRLKGRPSTKMQADIADDVTFMKEFEYQAEDQLEQAIAEAAKWGEETVIKRAVNFNHKYEWRSPAKLMR